MKTFFGATCTGCGKPIAFELGAPGGFRCDACGTTGAHPPPVAQRLREANAILTRTDVRARQFSGIQRFSLKASGLLLGGYVLLFALMMVPTGCAAGCSVIHAVGGTPAGMLMMGMPPLILVPSGLFGLWLILRTRRRLREVSAAIPPAAAGAPARCRVCGGPLESTVSDVVVRCGYCSADCVVTKGVLDGLRGRLQLTTEHVGAVVSRSATAVGTGLVGLVLLPIAVLVVPVGSFLIIASVFSFYIDEREDPPDLSTEYVVERVPRVELECIGVVRMRDGRRDRVAFGFYPSSVDGAHAYTRDLEDGSPPANPRTVTDFVGLTVLHARGVDPLRESTWTVVGAYKPPLHNDNVLRLRSVEGRQHEITVEPGRTMVCLVPEP